MVNSNDANLNTLQGDNEINTVSGIKKEKALIHNETTTNKCEDSKDCEIEMTTEMSEKSSDSQQKDPTTLTPDITTLPSDIINNIHSNSYFDNFSSISPKENGKEIQTTETFKEVEKTMGGDDIPSTETIMTNSETEVITKSTTNITDDNENTEQTHNTDKLPSDTDNKSTETASEETIPENINEVNTVINETLEAADRMDVSTERSGDSAQISKEESSTNSTYLHNFNELGSSTEDLIALETTTKHRVIQEKSVFLTEPPTTVQAEVLDTVKTVVHFITSDEVNDVASPDNIHNDPSITTTSTTVSPTTTSTDSSTNKTYEVNEASLDITTTEKLFISTKPTTEMVVSEDELSVEPLTKINVENEDTKEVASRSIDSSESNNISDEYLIKDYTVDENSTKKQIQNHVLAEKSSPNDIKPVTEDFELPKFIRCNLEQFQCTNGTSIKDSSYCIPKNDRCDSVFDCSDGSDEVKCEEEKCPNNFQVGML